jgi:hypothetical protein
MGFNREKLTESQFNRQKSGLHCRRPPWVFSRNQFLASHGDAHNIAPLANPVIALTVDAFVFPERTLADGQRFSPENLSSEPGRRKKFPARLARPIELVCASC